MSGIVGLFDPWGGSSDPEDVSTMHERIAHRGPDGGDTWIDDTVGLGIQVLASTPEARFETQPARDGDVVVVADARIDNREELLADLSLASPTDDPVTDSELLGAAYRRWGTDCVSHLIGAFAFAVWDAVSDTVFCARDHLGVKPFFYHSGDVFAFSSEQKALLALPSVRHDVDETNVGDFLAGLHEDEARTFYTAIRRLPPAHAMTVSASGAPRLWRYWDLDPTRSITLESDAAYERRFRELLEEAIRCRLRSPDPVGCALSGGLDSSSITVVARDLLADHRPLHTFSNVFDDAPSSDEREFVETVIDHDGIVPHYVFSDDVGSLVDLDALLDQFDQPPHNTMHFSRWMKARRTRAAGVGVVLGGALGDSAVDYGLGSLAQSLRTGRWRHLYEELRAMGEILDAPTKHLFVRHALKPTIPDALLRHYRRFHGTPVGLDAANPTLDPTFVDRIDLEARYATQTADDSVLGQTARRRQYDSLTTGRISASFETSDLTNAAFGIEQRYPFTDVRLLEFSLAIPPTQQLRGGWTRSILRRSLDDVLPDPIQWRPWKTTMNEAFWNALSVEDERLQALLADPGHLDRYLDLDALREAYDRFVDEPTTRDARPLWRALSLSVWLDRASTSRPLPTNATRREYTYQSP